MDINKSTNSQSNNPISDKMAERILEVIKNCKDEIFRCPECGLEEELCSYRFEPIHFTEKGVLCPDCLAAFLLKNVSVMAEVNV